MTLRHIAIIVSAMAISLTIFNATRAPVKIIRPIVAEHNACVRKKQKSQDIIAACTTVLKRDVSAPFKHQYYVSRAWAHRRAGDFDQALTDIDAAIRLQPKNVSDWEDRAYIHNAAGDFDAAEADFETAIALKPARVHTYLNRARLYEKRDDYDKALRDYQTVLELAPANNKALDKIVKIYLKRREYDVAVAFLNETVSRWKRTSTPYWVLGLIHVQQTGEYEKALSAFNTFAQLEQEDGVGSVMLATVYFKLNDDETGADFVEKGVQQGMDWAAKREGIKDKILQGIAKYILGVNTETSLRASTYSVAGRPDIGAKLFEQFDADGGQAARKVLIKQFEGEGLLPVSGSQIDDDNIAENIRRYSDHLSQIFSLEKWVGKW